MSDDLDFMRRAMGLAADMRRRTSPNPWVGCVVVSDDGQVFAGATRPPGGAHAEAVALSAAGSAAHGATLYSTLEPCSHVGRTPPCVEAIVAAGVRRVVVGVTDPDVRVAGRGLAHLGAQGIDVHVGVLGDEIGEQLRPYLLHRRTGRPFVVLKLAATLDGRTAAPDGSSRWITSPEARRAVHQLRADCDAILVGSATVRADNPALTVRDVDGPSPRRVVLGRAPADAAVHPCLEWTGSIPDLLDHLGEQGVLQLLVEGGAAVASSFHHGGFVDHYVFHLAPALFGGADAHSVFSGRGAATIGDLWRGKLVSCRLIGPDLEVVMEPVRA